jgi:molybdopterin molybdotransferase
MQGRQEYIAVADALELLLTRSKPGAEVERVDPRSAYGRVLAEDISARRDVPASDTSLMDGYAVRAVDLVQARKGTPVWVHVSGEARPGEEKGARLGRGEAVAVSTGTQRGGAVGSGFRRRQLNGKTCTGQGLT